MILSGALKLEILKIIAFDTIEKKLFSQKSLLFFRLWSIYFANMKIAILRIFNSALISKISSFSAHLF